MRSRRRRPAGWSAPPGRAAFLKRKLGLGQQVEHTINAAWLRLGGGLELDDWSDDEAWQGRMQQQKVRWLYTNHLMGEGYWVWLIPLGTGAISIGIVADPRFHPFERISTLEAALEWLDEHEPLVADAVRSRPDDVQDFLRVEDYAYQVERVYSPERWCLTGDAGAFTDPFYSPGSDFIGARQHLHHRPRHARPRRRAGRGAARAVQRPVPAAVHAPARLLHRTCTRSGATRR